MRKSPQSILNHSRRQFSVPSNILLQVFKGHEYFTQKNLFNESYNQVIHSDHLCNIRAERVSLQLEVKNSIYIYQFLLIVGKRFNCWKEGRNRNYNEIWHGIARVPMCKSGFNESWCWRGWYCVPARPVTWLPDGFASMVTSAFAYLPSLTPPFRISHGPRPETRGTSLYEYRRWGAGATLTRERVNKTRKAIWMIIWVQSKYALIILSTHVSNLNRIDGLRPE